MKILLIFASILCVAFKMPYTEKKEFIVLPSPGEASGMFSVFLTVLGMLDFYEKSEWAGLRVDFGKEGLYYDPSMGPNWWEYYFAPVGCGEESGCRVKSVKHRLISRVNRESHLRMTRQRGHELIQKYVRLLPALEKKVAEFMHKQFKDYAIIGVHYRGTDKERETGRVPYARVYAGIREAISMLGTDRYKIFVATDEEQFLKEISAEFKDRILYIEAKRSTDGSAVHFAQKNQYAIGEQAVLDCLLLSRTNFLVRTLSNLSHCSLFFNPTLPAITVKAR